jgi:hypothetical protein
LNFHLNSPTVDCLLFVVEGGRGSLIAINDPPFGQIVGTHLDSYLVPKKYSNEIHSHLS